MSKAVVHCQLAQVICSHIILCQGFSGALHLPSAKKKKCVGGRQLQLMTVGDIGVVTAQRVEYYVKLTQVTNEMWKQTERVMVQVRGLQ